MADTLQNQSTAIGSRIRTMRRARRLTQRHRLALELLQRRYAAGEISGEEYEQRKAVLTRDAGARS